MLVALFNTPKNADDWSVWSWHNANDHLEIRQAIAAQKKTNLTDYQVYPIFEGDVPGFLQRHSQLHIEMLGALGLQGEDLLDVDFNDESQKEAWMNLHVRDHIAARAALQSGPRVPSALARAACCPEWPSGEQGADPRRAG